jgi:ribosomal protein S27E
MTMFQNIRRSLHPHSTLKVQCETCGHLTTWSHQEAVARCGADATPFEIRRRLKCKACGAEGRARVWI